MRKDQATNARLRKVHIAAPPENSCPGRNKKQENQGTALLRIKDIAYSVAFLG